VVARDGKSLPGLGVLQALTGRLEEAPAVPVGLSAQWERVNERVTRPHACQ